MKYKDTTLYFRGAAITRSHFKWLIKTYHMDQASTILLSGGSAGGIAVYLWDEYLRSMVRKPFVVKSVPDSGIFLLVDTYKSNLPLLEITIVNLFKLSNQDEKTPILLCDKQYKDY